VKKTTYKGVFWKTLIPIERAGSQYASAYGTLSLGSCSKFLTTTRSRLGVVYHISNNDAWGTWEGDM